MEPLSNMTLPFAGLRVLECATVLAGPAVGAFFAELGAEVIKIEPPLGDVTRHWKRPEENKESSCSAYFSAVNWGKKSVVLDLKKERGIFHKLAQNSDIVIANYKPGAAERLGVDYPTLKKLNPMLLYGHLTGYGPHNSRTGYDAIIQAESGFLHLNGYPDQAPAKMPVALIDILAAHQLKEALLVGLWMREKQQSGGYFSVSLLDSALVSLANQASNWLIAGHNPQPMGLSHPNIVPYGNLYTTLDQKKIMLAVGSDAHFARLCSILKIEPETRFKTNSKRLEHRNDLDRTLGKAIQKHKAAPLLKQLWKQSIPAGEVKQVSEALANPDIAHLFLKASQQGLKGLRQNSFINEDLSTPALCAPPELGQDTQRVLENL